MHRPHNKMHPPSSRSSIQPPPNPLPGRLLSQPSKNQRNFTKSVAKSTLSTPPSPS